MRVQYINTKVIKLMGRQLPDTQEKNFAPQSYMFL